MPTRCSPHPPPCTYRLVPTRATVRSHRVARQAGDRTAAFRILHDHAEEPLERRDLVEARLLCVDVVPLLARARRLDDAARLLGYLEGTGLLDAPALGALVAPTAGSARTSA